MNKIIVVLISWTRMSALNIAAFAKNVVLLMTGNTHFPTPDVSLTILGAAATRLQTAYSKRRNGAEGKQEYADALEAMKGLLYSQAHYVDDIAKGDANIIISSGFEPSKNGRVISVTPATPAAVILNAIVGGILHLKVLPVPGAKSYMYVVFLGDDTFNIDVHGNHITMPPSSIRTIIINEGRVHEKLTGLPAGTMAYVQVLAQNAAGKSPFSPLVSVRLV